MSKTSVVVGLFILLSAFSFDADAQTCPALSVREMALTPTGHVTVTASGTSQNVALPTNSGSTPAATTVLVTNTGTVSGVWVVLGDSSVTASTSTGIPIPVGQSLELSIGTNTYIAYFGSGGVGITTGF
jgi:hypothetical protein